MPTAVGAIVLLLLPLVWSCNADGLVVYVHTYMSWVTLQVTNACIAQCKIGLEIVRLAAATHSVTTPASTSVRPHFT